MRKPRRILRERFRSIRSPWKPIISWACCCDASAKSTSRRTSFENPANWKRSAVRRATCDSDCCCRNDENMPDDSSTNGIRRNLIVPNRSEERRVGKECRYRWSRDQLNKKNEETTLIAVV